MVLLSGLTRRTLSSGSSAASNPSYCECAPMMSPAQASTARCRRTTTSTTAPIRTGVGIRTCPSGSSRPSLASRATTTCESGRSAMTQPTRRCFRQRPPLLRGTLRQAALFRALTCPAVSAVRRLVSTYKRTAHIGSSCYARTPHPPMRADRARTLLHPKTYPQGSARAKAATPDCPFPATFGYPSRSQTVEAPPLQGGAPSVQRKRSFAGTSRRSGRFDQRTLLTREGTR